MNILITGATGLLGNRLTAELMARGHQVGIISRDLKRARATLGAGGHYLLWGERSPFLAKTDVLIHLAGAGVADRRWSVSRKQELRDSRIATAAQVLEELKAADAPLRVIITASGTGFYGDRGDDILTESSIPGTDFLARLCVDWERATQDIPNCRWLALRTGPVLARQGGFLARLVPLYKILGASRLGSGRHYLAWIHINDWVRLLLWCLENPAISGAVNAVAPTPVRNSEMTQLLRQTLRTFPNLPVPQLVVRLLFGELATALFCSQRVIPEKALKTGFQFQFSTLAEALKNLFADGAGR